MAPPIKLFENRAILFKAESAYGQDALPTAIANALLSFEGSVKLEADKLERKQDLPYFGGDPFVLVGKRATAEFTIEMIGAAAAGTSAPIAPVLLCLGHAETLTAGVKAVYNPVSSAFASATIYFYHAGVLFKIRGARGTVEWDISIKDYAKGKCTFTGIITVADISEATPGALTLTAFQVPPAVEMETMFVSVGGVTLNAQKLTLNQNGDVKMFEGSEAREVAITDRKPSGTLTIFADELANFHPWQIADSLANQAIVLEVDGGPNRKCALDLGAAQLEYASIDNSDGATVWTIPYVAKPKLGGDEYVWTFT